MMTENPYYITDRPFRIVTNHEVFFVWGSKKEAISFAKRHKCKVLKVMKFRTDIVFDGTNKKVNMDYLRMCDLCYHFSYGVLPTISFINQP